MPRHRLALVSIGCLLAHVVPALADPPIIAGFEMKKQREERAAAIRDPKAFWARQIVLSIENKRPPRTRLPTGETLVHFVVGRDGAIVSEAVAHSSGRQDLDRLALEMVDRAAPFPPMPASISDSTVEFDLPLRFR